MTANVLAFLITFAAAATLHQRRASPALMFLVAGATYVCVGGFIAMAFYITPELFNAVTINRQGTDRSFHDTYYVIANYHYLATIGLTPLVVAAMLGLQHRLGALYFPNLSRWLFWPFMLFLASNLLSTLFWRYRTPRRYIDYPDDAQLVLNLQIYATFIGAAAVALLLILSLHGLIRRAKQNHRSLPDR